MANFHRAGTKMCVGDCCLKCNVKKSIRIFVKKIGQCVYYNGSHNYNSRYLLNSFRLFHCRQNVESFNFYKVIKNVRIRKINIILQLQTSTVISTK